MAADRRLVAGVLVLALGGVAFAVIDEQANADRILMGTTVAGIDVSGMTRAEAVAVRGGVRDDLRREITVVVRASGSRSRPGS